MNLNLRLLSIRLLFCISISYSVCTAQEIKPSSDDHQKKITLQKRAAYQQRLTQLEQYRNKQKIAYSAASSAKKQSILKQVRTKLTTELTEQLFPAWYGTPWNFNGTSNKPGEGKIACGYFVSTCLQHLGYKVNRYTLAQQPSQHIIQTFVPRSAMDISSQRSLPNVKKQLLKSGDGIYIVGLDRHVGFVSVQGERITFIHSSYYLPARAVIAEPYDSKNPLADSKYRVFGKIFHDKMLVKWLYQKPYVVVK